MPGIQLFGDDFMLESEKEKIKKIKSKIAKPKKVSTASTLNSKVVSIEEKLKIINVEVNRILGVYINDTVVIDNINDFQKYIDESIKNKIIVVDTETNNSLDPLTCKLMGLCLYTPGQKNAYIPVNHTDLDNNKLDNQITEQQIYEQLERVNSSDCKIIFHNAKFDYKVIYCTCGIRLRIDWDTMIGAKILDENELAGLKKQYINKIDPTIEKYSIDHLFTVPYQYVAPNVFALYAATDSFMTYKLYLYQLIEFNRPDNRKIFKLFLNVELPIITVSAQMELWGVCLDEEYVKRLSAKYHKNLDKINDGINDELKKLKPSINSWSLTPDATVHILKDNKNISIDIDKYNALSKDDKKLYAKSKFEQLSDPIETTSPTQLAILLYDIMKVPVVDKDNPRGTGIEILEKLVGKYAIIDLIVEQRSLLKMIDAFIDQLPALRSTRDNRIHSSFNQLGTATGRFSCTEPNLQQIPSRESSIRMMFEATDDIKEVDVDNKLELKYYEDIEIDNNWVRANKLKVGDTIRLEDGDLVIKSIEENNGVYTILFL